MSNHEHTTTPWTVSRSKRNRICGPDGVIVAEAWYPPARAKRDAKLDARVIGNSNAAFIVLAVNAFDALLDAVKLTECPHTNNGNEMAVDCYAAGDCGCCYGYALSLANPDQPENTRAQERIV